jgi:hypothetical protein
VVPTGVWTSARPKEVAGAAEAAAWWMTDTPRSPRHHAHTPAPTYMFLSDPSHAASVAAASAEVEAAERAKARKKAAVSVPGGTRSQQWREHLEARAAAEAARSALLAGDGSRAAHAAARPSASTRSVSSSSRGPAGTFRGETVVPFATRELDLWRAKQARATSAGRPGSGPPAASTVAAATTTSSSSSSPHASQRTREKEVSEAAQATLLTAINSKLHSELASIDGALRLGTPSTEACDACFDVMHSLGPLLGPLEPTLLQIAAETRRAARTPFRGAFTNLEAVESKQGKAAGSEAGEEAEEMVRGVHYFACAEKQLRTIRTLTAERDAALLRDDEQRKRVAVAEAALAETKAQLEEQTERIDTLMKEDAARQRALEKVLEQQRTQEERSAEARETHGHVMREHMEEHRKLSEKLEELHEEHNRFLRERDIPVAPREGVKARLWATHEVQRRMQSILDLERDSGKAKTSRLARRPLHGALGPATPRRTKQASLTVH